MSGRKVLPAPDMAQRLAEAEATIAALLSGQIDAVVDPKSQTPVLLAKAQDALRESEDRLRHERDRAQRFLDTAEVILLALDVEGRITLINRKGCDILGWSEAELLGRSFLETCLPERLRPSLTKRFGEVVRGDLAVVEAPLLTRSGAERLIEWRNTVLHDSDGRPTGTFSSGTDITERHQAIESLRTAEERMRFALEAAKVGIWDLDYGAGTIRWSAILQAQYGLAPGTLGGTVDAFLAGIHPDDRDAVVKTMAQAMVSGSDFSITHRSIWADGTVRWLSGAGRILVNDRGEPLRGVGISQDVTEGRLLEAQYQQAQKMEAIGRLASGVAHDFNNLLTVILGFAECVTKEGVLTSQSHSDLEEVTKAAQRATGLTRQLLAFSRQQVLHTAPLDVNGLISEMTGMLGRLIGEDVQIALALSPTLSLALADRGQLEQVVMNLVVNARDAMSGGGTVTIETADINLENSSFHEEAVMRGTYVMIAVTDTGSGMTPETQRRLFEPFFTTKDAGKGTGLGLSTTYGIVKQSKGYIWVYSEFGVGTTFKVYLPRTDNAAAAAVSPAIVAPIERSSQTVLLVEDEAGVRHLARRFLEGAGYRVLEAANGDDAEKLFALKSDVIDLLVTDVVMPGCSGPELLSRLQAHAAALRVLYMSGYTEQAAANRAGIDRGLPFVQKPFTKAQLLSHVRDALDR